MGTKIKALEKNKTWELVSLPKGKKPVGCKWAYMIKYKANGSIERDKAKLVAKDYSKTFTSVAKMNTVQVILSLATNYGWEL
ncbi:hypothetical protein CR513_58451, partial [Mucuna pruriens]